MSDASLITKITIHDNPSPWDNQVVWAGDAVVHLEFRNDEHRRLWRVIRHRPPSWSREVLADAVEGTRCVSAWSRLDSLWSRL